MIRIEDDGRMVGAEVDPLSYIKKRGIIGRCVLPVTRWLRAIHTEKYMVSQGEQTRHLDIGSGDGYFLRRSQCQERVGLDKLYGDDLEDIATLSEDHFDYVTMLAVIEHLPDPEKTLKDIARILKPKGRLIMTTPKKSAEWLIRLYVKDIDDEHESYFDLERMRNLAGDCFTVVGHHTFILGLNQAFCLEKNEMDAV